MAVYKTDIHLCSNFVFIFFCFNLKYSAKESRLKRGGSIHLKQLLDIF